MGLISGLISRATGSSRRTTGGRGPVGRGTAGRGTGVGGAGGSGVGGLLSRLTRGGRRL